MIPVHTARQVRDAEEAWFAENPGRRDELMQRASTAVAELAHRILAGEFAQRGSDRARPPADRPRRVLVAAGGGNNGGDALFAAAQLAAAGCEVAVWLSGDDAHAAGLEAARTAGCLEIDALQACQAVAEVDLLIDGVLGTGGRPGLPAVVATLAAEADALGVETLAVDLPSGLDADSGATAAESFRATHTITFIARKPCHVMEPAASRCGQVHLAQIGVDLARPEIVQLAADDIAPRWPVPGPTSDKYSRGVLGLDTGSQRYPGAAVLGANGAQYSGAGMIRFAGAPAAAATIASQLPAITHGEGRVQAWAVGSGWGHTDANRDRLATRLAVGVPLVIDADALTVLPEKLPAGCLLTPHAGELARMLDVERSAVEADPIGHARAAARRWQATVLLKGATQYVVDPDGPVLLAVPGPHWSAQAGSGDVLAGICGTLLAAGLPPRWAGALAASVQAIAASRRRGPWPPEVIAREVASVVGKFDRH